MEADGLTLEFKRVLPAAPPEVFRLFADPGELARWWGPAGFSVASLDFNPAVGSSYRIEMQPPDGDAFYLTGEFREVDPPTQLSFTFVWEPPDPDDVETLVELSFREAGDATEVDFRQGTFKTEERRELHRSGWGDSFEKVEAIVGGQ
ncbi:MAG TPA: SRPBCC domain-containing protein [Solirubrobacterales bacterium]|nr:SRPBCC domain-containing protein [Solirubrobacterales bacterium]